MINIYTLHSGQTGAPVLSGSADALSSVLYAALVTGYNNQTLDSLSRVDTIATATVAAGHGFTNGDIVRIAGATQTEYNGDFVVANATTTTFDFTVTGTPATPATGTITAKIAPLGWTRPFTGTNKAAFRPASGNQRYLKIDETDNVAGVGNRCAVVEMFESMTDIDNGTGSSNGAGAIFWRKSNAEDATARNWYVIGDGARFYFCVNWLLAGDNLYTYTPYFFGDVPSFVSGDTWNTMLGGQIAAGSDSYPQGYNQILTFHSEIDYAIPANPGVVLARDRTQTGGAVPVVFTLGAMGAAQNQDGYGITLAFPNAADNGLYVVPEMIKETGAFRGRRPGYYLPLMKKTISTPEKFEGFQVDGTSRTLLMLKNGSSNYSYPDRKGVFCLDLTGPWA